MVEKPSPGGKSKNAIFDILFQENLFFFKFPFFFILKGPFSKNTENSDEHPGPPVNQNTKGASIFLSSHGKYQ